MTRCSATCRGSTMRSKRCSTTCVITGFVKICGLSKSVLASSGSKLRSPLLQGSEIASLLHRTNISRMCRRYRVRGRDQPFLVALAEHFQPPILVTVRVAARKKPPHRVGADLGNPQPTRIHQGEQPARAEVVCPLPVGLAGHRVD